MNGRASCFLAALLALLPTAAPGGQAKLSVEMDGAGVSVESERYVAVFAQNTLWTHPIREVVAEPNESLPSWELPAGRYMAMCSADGFAYDLVPPFDLSAGEQRKIHCSLPRLGRIEGKLVSEESGSPVADAQVTHTWLLDADRVYRVSPRGEEHLAKNFSATSGEEGVFSVGSMPGERPVLWVVAEGHAAQRIGVSQAPRPAAAASIGEISLARGGALELVLPATADRLPGSVLTLRRLSPEVDAGLETPPPGVWSRPVPKEGGAVAWRSLAPGRYEVWLNPPSSTGGGPEVVGAHDVMVGPPKRVVASLPSRWPQTESEIVVRLPEDSPATALRAWQWHDGRLHEVPLLELANPKRLVVKGGCRPQTITLLTGEHVVSPPYVLPPSVCRSAEGGVTLDATLIPAGEIGGRLAVPFGFELPSTAALRVDRCSRAAWEDRAPLGTFPATVSNDGSWKALLPAGCANLSLRVRGFSPLVWEGVEITARSVRQLGGRRLEPGGTLLVRVIAASDGRGVEGARVEMFEEGSLEAAVRASLDQRPVVSLAGQLTDEQGWARFDSLPAGTFALRATDSEGSRLGFSRSFLVHPAQDHVLPDIELAALGSLVLQATGPSGRSLEDERVVVRGLVDVADCGWELAFDAVLNPEENWTAEVAHVIPGSWRLVPQLTVDGEEASVELAPVEVTIGSGERREVQLAITGSSFEGLVTLADAPIPAELRFRVPGKGTYTARSSSDENGQFSVTLPEPGRYDVVVINERIATTVGGVELLDSTERVRIELPSGAITGIVLDDEGQPVGNASVLAASGSGFEGEGETPRLEAQAITDSTGRFRIEGLVAARWGIHAWDGERRSAPRHVEVSTEGEIGGIRLVVGSGAMLQGRLLVAGAPVAAASGSVVAASVPLDAPGGLHSFRTDAEGSFAIDLGPGAEGLVHIAVTDPRLPASAFLVSAPGDPDLHVAPVGGRTILLGVGITWENVPHHRLALVNGQGAHLALNDVPGLVVSNGDAGGAPRVVLPNLEPGLWSLVAIRTLGDAHALVSGRGTSLAPIARFEVHAASTTEVNLSADDG